MKTYSKTFIYALRQNLDTHSCRNIQLAGKYFPSNLIYCALLSYREQNIKLLSKALLDCTSDYLFLFSKSQKHFTIFIDHAEIVLHDHWGNKDFWQARRSMRFNQDLVDVANQYRELRFQSNDHVDRVQRPDNWQLEKPYRKAIGGNYICAHLRRADFLYGRERTIPTLRSAANQIKQKLREHSVDNVFISSDCSKKGEHKFRLFLNFGEI